MSLALAVSPPDVSTPPTEPSARPARVSRSVPPLSARDRAIAEHYPVVRSVARRLAGRYPAGVDLEELVAMGTLGLLDAIDRYDPSRGVPFRAYAAIRIRGAIVDALRANDWAPRAVRRSSNRLEGALGELRQRLGREPTREEAAAALDLTPEAYDRFASSAQALRLVSIDQPVTPEGELPLREMIASDEDTPMDLWLRAEATEAALKAVEDLPERERRVVTLLYRGGRTLREVGEELGVTESRACQLHGQAIKRLRRSLGGVA